MKSEEAFSSFGGWGWQSFEWILNMCNPFCYTVFCYLLLYFSPEVYFIIFPKEKVAYEAMNEKKIIKRVSNFFFGNQRQGSILYIENPN